MVAEAAIILIFFVVYAGMILGGLPFLQLDRTGVALLGAIALVSIGALTLEEAWDAIHAPTLILLFAFMVMSSQLRLGGCCRLRRTRPPARCSHSPAPWQGIC